MVRAHNRGVALVLVGKLGTVRLQGVHGVVSLYRIFSFYEVV